MASMIIDVTDGWLQITCQGKGMTACGATYQAHTSVPLAMAAAVRKAAAHVCGQEDDPRLLMRGSAEVCDGTIEAIDQQARAYGYEIGRGHPLVEVLQHIDANPFIDPDWRSKINRVRDPRDEMHGAEFEATDAITDDGPTRLGGF